MPVPAGTIDRNAWNPADPVIPHNPLVLDDDGKLELCGGSCSLELDDENDDENDDVLEGCESMLLSLSSSLESEEGLPPPPPPPPVPGGVVTEGPPSSDCCIYRPICSGSSGKISISARGTVNSSFATAVRAARRSFSLIAFSAVELSLAA